MQLDGVSLIVLISNNRKHLTDPKRSIISELWGAHSDGRTNSVLSFVPNNGCVCLDDDSVEWQSGISALFVEGSWIAFEAISGIMTSSPSFDWIQGPLSIYSVPCSVYTVAETPFPLRSSTTVLKSQWNMPHLALKTCSRRSNNCSILSLELTRPTSNDISLVKSSAEVGF